MQSQNLPVTEGKSKNWPDFYSILNSSPDIDTETLRRSINALYIKANQDSDHRELSVRFYNQVLSEKVLPQCRKILLNDVSRRAYDEQWYLHRDGVESALSYQEFIHVISKDPSTERSLLLSADEISLLPSFTGPAPVQNRGRSTLDAVSTPISNPAASATSANGPVPHADIPTVEPEGEVIEGQYVVDGDDVIEGEEVIEPRSSTPAFAPSAPVTSSFVVAPNSQPSAGGKKAFPVLPVVGGVLFLGIVGFFLTRGGSDETEPNLEFQVAQTRAKAKAAAEASKTAGTGAALDHPIMKLNTLALNADFENGRLDPWVTSNKQAYVEDAPLKNAKSGNGIFTFWDTVPYDASMHQNITGLTPGKYTLRAWTQRTGGQERAEMSATGYGGPTRIVTLPDTPTWSQVTIKDIDVKIDRCTIGFSAKGPATKHVQVDCVEFFKQ